VGLSFCWANGHVVAHPERERGGGLNHANMQKNAGFKKYFVKKFEKGFGFGGKKQ